ncbi:MAG: Ricin and poly(3-hydroxybutyrate) depolymerase fusion [Polyangiaceae bacterium]|nr:Ricin and poly(3-hydroxybutyrate) depolymerase fusion [Polyangiaceae bacterium]
MRKSKSAYAAVLVGSVLAFSCGDDSSSLTEGDTGGGAATGGAAASSGGSANSGASLLGGQAPTGGVAPSGGVQSTGGAAGTGGDTSATGGAAGTGGVAWTGGAVGIGGDTTGTGGAVGTGGDTTGTGGAVGTGGDAAGTGGAVGTGGDAAGTGGAVGTGGDAAGTGGAVGTGGDTSGTGGAVGTGGDSSGTGGGGGVSPGCGSANVTSPCGVRGTTCSLDVDGTERTYYVELPSDYSSSTQYPVIFQFHPWGGSADQAMTMYQLKSKIPDAIYVTPQGLQAGGAGAGWANTNGEDIAFTKAMLADIQSKYCVDTSRIFSTGFSYGGMMSFAIGCEMGDVFRAIAPMSGSLYSDFNCQGTGHPIAMWGSHGISDDVVPIEDGRAALDKILKQNHCGSDTTPVEPSPCVKYEGCDPGYEVTWCEWDGPHGMPSFGSSAVAEFFMQF